MKASSSQIISNQHDIHPDIITIVNKHLCSNFTKPIAEHTREAFNAFIRWLHSKRHVQTDESTCSSLFSIILDSGCGVGESTIKLAHRFPRHVIIGVDKSALRIAKAFKNLEEHGDQSIAERVFFVQADLIDFWRLLVDENTNDTGPQAQTNTPIKNKLITIDHHYILYPNPWPKKKHIMRRWHTHPIFPLIIQIGKKLHVRSNWDIYIKECAYVFINVLHNTSVKTETIAITNEQECMTPFERKYFLSGQQLYSLSINLLGN